MRYHHYDHRTKDAYVSWIKQIILFHQEQRPKDMGKKEIEMFLSYLAVDRNVAVSTQNQVFNALLFLYKQVLYLSFADHISAIRAKKAPCLPVVLSVQEMARLLGVMLR